MASHHGRPDKDPTMYIPIVESWIFGKRRQRNNKGGDVGSPTTDPDNKNSGEGGKSHPGDKWKD